MTELPEIFNLRNRPVPKDVVRVDRRSPWGNRFRIGRDGDRAEVVLKHLKDVLEASNDLIRERMREELRGCRLSCWCVPEACHAVTVRAIANNVDPIAAPDWHVSLVDWDGLIRGERENEVHPCTNWYYLYCDCKGACGCHEAR